MGKLLDMLKGMIGRDTPDGHCHDHQPRGKTAETVSKGDRQEAKGAADELRGELGQLSPSPTPGQEGAGGSEAAQGRSLSQEGQGR